MSLVALNVEKNQKQRQRPRVSNHFFSFADWWFCYVLFAFDVCQIAIPAHGPRIYEALQGAGLETPVVPWRLILIFSGPPKKMGSPSNDGFPMV